MYQKNHLNLSQWLIVAGLGLSGLLYSCTDDYVYAKEEPSEDILGSSIYDYLVDDGNFTTFIRLIDDLDYRETLQRTGSKTLFPARDDAFERFFRDNKFGVHSYEELSISQKKMLLNQATVNMAYLAEMLPNIGGTTGPTENVALRRSTQSAYYDSVQIVHDQELFNNENGFWKRFAEDNDGIMLVEESPMLVQFTPQVMNARSITASDFSLMHNGTPYDNGDIYINGIKVIERDKICKNGYVHVLADVLTPLRTMADAINSNEDSKQFARILNLFSAPYYDKEATEEIKRNFTGADPMYPSITIPRDSVFRRGYFNQLTHTSGPKGEELEGLLYFDPAQVSYSNSNTLADMGVMFVPTDAAMDAYFNSPEGSFLKTNYASWNDIPPSLLVLFIQNHQKKSFLTSLPHDWSTMNDETSFPMNIKPSDVDHVELCSNGVVYYLNRVVAPVHFRTTYAPSLVTDETRIMRWALTDNWDDLGDGNALRFYMYLYSMENMYNLLIPTDEALLNYRDPITWANNSNVGNREIWEFHFDYEKQVPYADVYSATADAEKDALKRTVTDLSTIRSRLKDILDMHIIVGNNNDGVLSGYVDDGSLGDFALTKGGANISIAGTGAAFTANGIGDEELGLSRAHVLEKPDGSPFIFDNDNGRTFFIDHILHDSRFSVYELLGENPEFQAFRDLCTVPSIGGIDMLFSSSLENPLTRIFEQKTGNIQSAGIVVSMFNNYRYTVFVPTEQAIQEAFANDPDLYTWDEIAEVTDKVEQRRRVEYLLKFIRYHFVDNSIYINGVSTGATRYNTSARTDYDTFHSVTVSRTPSSLTVTDENGRTCNIVKSASTNVSAREILYHSSIIDASSRAVLHKIDHALTFKK